jgi:hypothetical protein
VAALAGTGLQSRPRSGRLCEHDDRQQPGQRRVDAAARGNEVEPLGSRVDAQRGAAAGPGQGVERRRDGDLPAPVAIAAVTTVGYLGSFTGPPAVGAIAEIAGLSAALGLVVVAAIAIAALARVL